MNATVQEKRLVAPKVFSRLLVGIDGSEASREAARQAATLAEGRLTLLGAYNIASSLVGGTGLGVPAYYNEDYQRDAATAVVQQTRQEIEVAGATAKIAKGVVWDVLIDEAERAEDTLIAVGSHGHGRMAGIAMGSVATEVIHKAPCSVLVARRRSDEFPHRIVVGIDGSPQSLVAYAVAKQLAERFDAELTPVRAHGGKQVEAQLGDRLVGHYREDLPDEPVTALLAASADADLLIVGSRGLHGVRALGSVSERVAHQAHCSVLIVRESSGHSVEVVRAPRTVDQRQLDLALAAIHACAIRGPESQRRKVGCSPTSLSRTGPTKGAQP